MKNFLKKLKNRKIIVSLVMSYLLVLVVPYLGNRVSYISMENNLIDEIKNYNSEYLHGRVQTLDAIVANVSEMADTIFLDEAFREAASVTAPLSAQQRYKLSEESSYIYTGFEYYVENVFVLLKNADYYVGKNGAGNLRNFYEAHYSNRFSAYDEWYRFMTECYYGELVVHPDVQNQGDGTVFYAISYMDVGDSNRLLANIIVEFKKSFLLSDNNETNRFFMIDENNQVIVCDEDAAFVASANEALSKLTEDNVVYMRHADQNKILIVRDMVQSDWKYVSCIREDAFMSKIVDARRNYNYSLLCCVLLGGIIIIWAVKKHYMPIKKIARTLSKNFGYDSGLDEYQYLTEVVSKVAEQYHEDSQYQKLEKKLAKNSFLLSVLKGEEIPRDAFGRLKYFGIDFTNPFFCVAAIHIRDCTQLFFEGEDSEDNIGLSKLIIENVLEDLLKDRFEIAFCEEAEEIFVVCALQSQDSMRELRERLFESQEMIQQISNIFFSVTVSKTYEAISNLSVCYGEAVETMRYSKIRDDKFLLYEEYLQINREAKGDYCYSADTEMKLMNYLMYGNYEKSELLLEKILGSNLKHLNAASLKGKCLFFDIAATVFKMIRQNELLSDCRELVQADWLKKINDYDSISDIREELLTVFRRICDETKEISTGNAERLTDNITDFVKTQYRNCNLNVAFIAEKLGVSANYVSTVFKKETGIPLSEYINALRVEHAKELLNCTNLKVAEISEQVGFASLRTFSRVFHAIVGVSPAEYRKKNHL